MLSALLFVVKFNSRGGIAYPVIPESRKQQKAAGYRITAAACPV
jgi:hypothetical protein